MREKKLSKLPLILLGAAVVVGGILVNYKPLVGTEEEIYEAQVKAMQEQEAKKATADVSGDKRDKTSSEALAAEMKASVKTGQDPREEADTRPLVVKAAPPKDLKPTVNEAGVRGHWYSKEFRPK